MTSLTPHQKAALQFDNHISLTANAGSGKTFVLSRRYIEIVLRENISLRNIAAITFTDKAASELYKKIANQIEERLKQAKDKKAAAKLENMRRQLVSANISTIHSFCIDILREYPVEAGLDANFSPIDEQLSTELIELSVDETIKAAIQNEHDETNFKKLIRFFASKSLFTGEIISLIKNRKNVLKIEDEIYQGGVEKTAEFFAGKFKELIPAVLLKEDAEIINTISDINEAVLNSKPDNSTALEVIPLIKNIIGETDNSRRLTIYSEIKNIIATQKNTLKIREYLGKLKDEYSIETELLERFFSDLDSLNLPENTTEIETELACYGYSILYFFKKALERYLNKKKENGFLDYEDILLFTQDVLSREDVRQSLSEKYKYIMIDEYQDTNEIQYNIFLPILDKLKKGNLFVVGDEKQSIYMFRDAELEVFNRTKHDIAGKSGDQFLLTLPDSFRMAPVISLFTNLLFKKLFAEPDLLYNEVEHNDIVCARSDEVKGKIEILISSPDVKESLNGDEDADEGDSEAENVAKRIMKLCDNDFSDNFGWNNIAILCRKRKAFAGLEKAFVKYKIPFTILGGKGFYQRQSIYDIFNYFSFLLDDKNDTALIGVLRSPFFSIPDSKIFEISLARGKSYWEKLLDFAKKNPELKLITEILKTNSELANSYDITALLRKILNESDLLVTLSSKPNGVQETANINKLIKLTINFVSQGFKTLYDYVTFLRESIEKTEDEAQAVMPEETDSVKIMTIHQSKGLEFKAVFLYKCDDKSGNSSIKAKSFSVNKGLGLLTKVPVNENYFSEYEAAPIVGLANIISKRKNAAENKRMFYVAVTRAVDYLFISAGAKKDHKYAPNSFMDMLKCGLNIDFTSDEYRIRAPLKYLKVENGDYKTIETQLDLFVPIIKNIEGNIVNDAFAVVESRKELSIGTIQDMTEGEIISATKVAIFNQCPVKYQLTYEFGFGDFFRDYRNWLLKKKKPPKIKSEYEYNGNEKKAIEENSELKSGSNLKNYGDLKGRIVHELLDKQNDKKNIKNEVRALIHIELSEFEKNGKIEEELLENISADLIKYFESNEYKKIIAYKDFQNEYEIYVQETDFYLYGIIDKIIFDQKKIIIIDYKTDDVTVEELNKKSGAYLTQLTFYAYIVSKLYPDINEIEIRLIFIKHPQNVIAQKIGNEELDVLKDVIYKMTKLTRTKNYTPVLEHCSSCYFALNRTCIKRADQTVS